MEDHMRGEPIAYWGLSQEDAGPQERVHFAAVDKYPGGEPLVKERPRYVGRVMLRPTNTHDLMGGLFWIQALRARSRREAQWLILPYVPGARQDRLNDEGDFLFTAKSVAGLINMVGFNRVTIFDPHSNVISSLIENVDVVSPTAYLPADFEENNYHYVLAPDAGSSHRALEVAKKTHGYLRQGWKKRDVSTGALSGFGCEDFPGNSRVLVVDDICDGGGTFIGLAEEVKRNRKLDRFDLFVTHGLFTKGTQDLLKHYDRIYTTDSVPAQRPGVNVDQVCLRLLTQGAL